MNPVQELALQLCWILPLTGATIAAVGIVFLWRYERYWNNYPWNKYN